MNKQDAGKLMAYLAAAYSHSLGTDELEVWYESTLRHLEPEVAETTARRLVAEDRYWPTPARFSEVRRAIERAVARPVELVEPLPSAEQVRPVISLIRETLQAYKGKQHWHGGPQPCSVCGGITSDPNTLERYANGRPEEVEQAERRVIVPRSNGHTFKQSAEGWHCECGHRYGTDEAESFSEHREHKAAVSRGAAA